MSPTMLDSSLKIRGVKRRNPTALGRLARLASGSALTAPALVAERDGFPVAANALTTGAVVADPRNSSRDIVGALKVLRYQAVRQSGQRGAVRSLLNRADSDLTSLAARTALAAPQV